MEWELPKHLIFAVHAASWFRQQSYPTDLKGKEGEEREGRNSLLITISPWLSVLKYKRMTLLIQLHLLLETFFPALPHI